MSRYFVIPLLFLMTACNLDGVKSSNDDSNEEIQLVDSLPTLNLEKKDTIERQGDQPFSLLKDSLGGQQNDMVYNGDNGLRVEWYSKRKTNKIELNDVVLVNYSSRIATGKVFDSNKEIGKPIPLKTNIGMMMKGLEQGLLQMHVGDNGRIMIPSALAYGEQGNGNVVPPNADIIVEIEVIKKIKPIVLEEGVKVYKWQTNPSGQTPIKNERISFDYFAYTVGEKGKRYDNSYKNSEPFTFKFENDNVIDGLHQGMSVMKNKENAFIEIPAHLAYGKAGLVDLVPKNTAIVYDVRIVGID